MSLNKRRYLGIWGSVLLAGSLMVPDAKALPDEFRSACAASPQFEDTFARRDLGANWKVVQRKAGINGNREIQSYGAQNLSLGEDGLRLSATSDAWGRISSARVYSAQTFLYGCFEVVARMPAGKGLWPAIWLRTDFMKPTNGEIDIMEGFGSHPGVIQSTLHNWANGAHMGATCARLGGAGDSLFGVKRGCAWHPLGWNMDFTAPHRYGLIWSPTGVSWYLDGQRYLETTNYIPNSPMAIHLNLAVGGVMDGDPDQSTRFPATMQIRSVRAWSLKR